jgi:hypothetical protein
VTLREAVAEVRSEIPDVSQGQALEQMLGLNEKTLKPILLELLADVRFRLLVHGHGIDEPSALAGMLAGVELALARQRCEP